MNCSWIVTKRNIPTILISFQNFVLIGLQYVIWNKILLTNSAALELLLQELPKMWSPWYLNRWWVDSRHWVKVFQSRACSNRLSRYVTPLCSTGFTILVYFCPGLNSCTVCLSWYPYKWYKKNWLSPCIAGKLKSWSNVNININKLLRC